MSVMFYDSNENVQSFEATAWQDVFSKSGNLNPRGNFIYASAEYSGNNTTDNVGIRVLLDNVEVSFDYHKPTLSGQYRKFCDFGLYTPTEAEQHTLKVQVRAVSAGTIVSVRRIRLMVQQV